MTAMRCDNRYFEEPQVKDGVKNPNRFTIGQHVFPRSSIARFCNADSKVQTNILSLSKIQNLSPKSDWFCAQRVWDQPTETIGARTTEAAYDQLARQIERGDIKTLCPVESDVVTRFHALWSARFEVRRNPPSSVEMIGVMPGAPLSKDAQENLEANGYSYALGSMLPSRQMAGHLVRFRSMQLALHWKGVTWGILRSNETEFLVPDNVVDIAFVPVSPNICLSLASDDRFVNPLEVAQINRLFTEFSERYYFARDLERCPIHRRTIPRTVLPSVTARASQ
ncbi:hypothetical protein ACSFBM_16550 [Variovorax sp. GB1R11]|uniref:hypothetical protein n=1 Tax=Variovorax sp. GB1R11 TaxID=3443741 RepID=UPI003F47806A